MQQKYFEISTILKMSRKYILHSNIVKSYSQISRVDRG